MLEFNYLPAGYCRLQGLLLPVSYDQVSYDCFLQTIKWIVEKEGYNSPNSMIQAIRLFLLVRIQEFFMPLLICHTARSYLRIKAFSPYNPYGVF